jgi:hypothetical protein
MRNYPPNEVSSLQLMLCAGELVADGVIAGGQVPHVSGDEDHARSLRSPRARKARGTLRHGGDRSAAGRGGCATPLAGEGERRRAKVWAGEGVNGS